MKNKRISISEICTGLKTVFLIISLLFFYSCHEKVQEVKMQEPDKKYLSESQLFALNLEIENDPDEAENYYQRARVYLERKDMIKSLTDIEKAISIDSKKGKYFLLKGRILTEMKRFEKAIEALDEAERLQVNDAELKLILADLYLQTGNKTKAAEYLEAASSIAPYHPEVLLLKGKIFALEGDTAQAVSHYYIVLSKDRGNIEAYKELSAIYYNRKKFDSSLVFLSTGRLYEPNEAFFSFQEGRILLSLNMEAAGLANFNNALMIDSTHTPTLNVLGNYWYKKGDYIQAKRYFEREVSYSQSSNSSFIRLADIYEKQGEGSLGIPLLEKVVKKDSTNREARLMLDKLYNKYPKPVEEDIKQDSLLGKKDISESSVQIDSIKKVKPSNSDEKNPKKDSVGRKPEPKPSVKSKNKDKVDNNFIPLIKNPDSTKIEAPKE